MDLALMTEPHLGGTYEDLLELARFAEEAGLASFARSDHYLSTRTDPPPDATDAFATLAGLARETERVRLCVLVAPITWRHPPVLAKTAATIDLMSGGRLDLGVGTGWMEEEHQALGIPFHDWEGRFQRLEEALRYLRAAFGDGEAELEGEHYRLGPVDVRPKPAQRPSIPLIVGGQGPRRTPTLAGTYADEYNHFVTTPEELGPKAEVARRAAAEAGRDPDALRVTMMGPVLVGRDEADYRRRLEEAAADRGRSPEEHEERWREAGIPIGTPAQVRETLDALTEAGVDTYYVQFLGTPSRAEVEPVFEALGA